MHFLGEFWLLQLHSCVAVGKYCFFQNHLSIQQPPSSKQARSTKFWEEQYFSYLSDRSGNYEMLGPGESCARGQTITSFDECERAADKLGIKYIALKNNKQNCYATRRNFDNRRRREICDTSGRRRGTGPTIVGPTGHTGTTRPTGSSVVGPVGFVGTVGSVMLLIQLAK